MSIKLVSAAASHIGKVRSANQDSGYCGYQLFFVADGMGGHAGGEFASALASQRIAQIDANYASPEDAGAAVLNVVLEANGKIAETVANQPELSGMGTTFSGLVFTGNQAVVGHIGDSRIYRSRDGELTQITKDHTFVQRLVDLGRITEKEAETHPRKNVLMRVLGDTAEVPQIDTEVFEVKAGDRYLLCSDGLCGFVNQELIARNMASNAPAEEVTDVLIGEALEAGAPDNVTVIVVDVLDAETPTEFTLEPKYVGAAQNEVVVQEKKGRKTLGLIDQRIFAGLFRGTEETTDFQPESEELLAKYQKQTLTKVRWRRVRQLLTILVLVAGAVAGLVFAYNYTQTKFYVAESNGHIAVFKGIRENLGPLAFSSVYEETNYLVADLPAYQQEQIARSIFATSPDDADRIIAQLLKARAND